MASEKKEPARVTVLPAQARVLMDLAYKYGCAIAVTQDGSVLTFDPGKHRKPIHVDAKGNPITYTRRRK